MRGPAPYRITRRLELVKRRLIRWNREEVGDIFRRLDEVEADITSLQRREDLEGGLPDDDLMTLRHCLSLHHSLLAQQESFWRQRSRVSWLQEGDRNTRFFHQATISRRAANRIRRLRTSEGDVVSDDAQVRALLLHFFRSRWSAQPEMAGSLLVPRPLVRVSDQENCSLTRPIADIEIREALWALGVDKAPGPDGFPPFFFRRYWSIIGPEVTEAIRAVFLSSFPDRWKQTFITLIPKRPDASDPAHFRPISLCTTLYKVCARLLLSRLQPIIPRLICPEQAAFIRGRSITDHVLIAQEYLSDLRRAPARRSLMAVKLDMERAYDCMSWHFLRRTLIDFGFQEPWITWVMHCIESPSFALLINGSPTEFFHSSVGLRQGCPLSPLLFILCADALSRALHAAALDQRLELSWPSSQSPGLSHLLFADDCLLLGRATLANARCFASIVLEYCRVSGQRVNLGKSSVLFSPRTAPRLQLAIRASLATPIHSGPFIYLGVPITGRRLRQVDCRVIVQRVRDRIQGWPVGSLSLMGRVTLLRSVLSSLPLYLMTSTTVPLSCLRGLERLFRSFLWGSDRDRSGVHLLPWDVLCQPLADGGLGLHSLVHRRQSLLARHAARLVSQPDSLWCSIMLDRYGPWRRGSLPPVPRGCSFLWKDICALAPPVLGHLRWIIGDGASVDVRSDAWISALPLDRWPTFVSIDLEDRLRVCDLISVRRAGWRSSFIIRSFGPELAVRILALPLPTHRSPDLISWSLAPASRPPSSLLAQLLPSSSRPSIRAGWIWKLPVHPRVRIFLWKVAWDRLPTRGLLHHRGLPIPSHCPVCALEEESVEHALLRCSRARLVWRLVGPRPWEEAPGSWIPPFLRRLQFGSAESSCRRAYLAYQIWLSRNSVVFDDFLLPVPRLIQRALSLAAEYCCSSVSLDVPRLVLWDSPAASAASPRALSVSWEPPPPGYVKINFDGSVRGSSGGAGFVIRDHDGRLLAAGGSRLVEPSVLSAELTAAWAGISFAAGILRADRLCIEGDSAVVIDWIRGLPGPSRPHPLLHDIWSFIRPPSVCTIRHAYREANSAADWVASFVAQHSGHWSVVSPAGLPSSFLFILYFDSLGCSRTRVV